MSKNIAVVDKDLEQIEEIKKGVGELVIRMAAIKIKTQADYETAISVGKEAAQSIKSLKLAVEVAGAPYKSKWDKIKAAGAAIVQSVETASDAMREQCRKFIRDEEIKKQKQLQELQLKRLEEQRKIEQADTAKDQQKQVAKVEKVEAKIETVAASKTENSTTYRKVEVIDESLVPREYLSVDMTKLNAVKGKVNTPFPVIPGVKIYDDKQVRFS